MTSEQRDPREAVMLSIQGRMFDAGKAEASSYYPSVRTESDTEALARLDAADPLRAVLPEVVEALEKIRAFTGHMDSTEEEVTEAWKLSREALARLREIHPTTGGADDA